MDTIRYSPRPKHHRIGYIHGSSTHPGIVEAIRSQIKDGERVLVILDSDHSKQHVLAELRAYNSFVTPGSYLIVEDTNRHGYHLAGGLPEGGPAEAVEEFMQENDEFEVDTSREDKFLMTFNPGGWLRRK